MGTARLLLENGADLRVKESKCGDTALHMAASLSCDPALVKVNKHTRFTYYTRYKVNNLNREKLTEKTEEKRVENTV